MIDHVLGRPSVQFRKIQVLAVVSFWSFYLFRGHKHGPPTLRKFSRKFSAHLTPWQTVVITLLYLYMARNLGKLVGLECPEPLANLYTRSYFRATWVTTALDAGFWTAMRIRRKWLRDLASIVFTVYYLLAAEQAEEKVRKVRGAITIDHLRVSWNKGTTPYIRFITDLLRPRFMRYPPRQIRIPRPANSDYKESITAWLYFDGPISALKKHTKIVIDVPGGGFVAMDPRHNDDKLFAWAGKTGLPVLSIDYGKAPEHPYPYAVNECFDAYRTIVSSRGRCLGLAGTIPPKIVVLGDSAGGNLAKGVMLMVIHARQNGSPITLPEGLVLIYPGLDMNIGGWMSIEHMSLIRDRKSRGTNRDIIKKKRMQYTLTANTPIQSEDEESTSPDVESLSFPKNFPLQNSSTTTSTLLSPPEMTTAPTTALSPELPRLSMDNSRPSTANSIFNTTATISSHPSAPLKTRLAMSSMLAYFNDRILSPEMMRAMIILYVGPHNRPDFTTDYLLSPILAPDSLLSDFPKTYFLTGERDPLVDDTVIFAGRLRRAKAAKYTEELARNNRKEIGKEWDDRDVVEVSLIPGISHGFLQFPTCFPEGWKHINRCGRWIQTIFAASDERDKVFNASVSGLANEMHHRRSRTESSAEEEGGLVMSMTTHKCRNREREEKERLLREMGQGVSEKGGNCNGIKGDGLELDKKGRNKSMVSLASEDDLLGRRMLGLAGPLTGLGNQD